MKEDEVPLKNTSSVLPSLHDIEKKKVYLSLLTESAIGDEMIFALIPVSFVSLVSAGYCNAV